MTHGVGDAAGMPFHNGARTLTGCAARRFVDEPYCACLGKLCRITDDATRLSRNQRVTELAMVFVIRAEQNRHRGVRGFGWALAAAPRHQAASDERDRGVLIKCS